MAGKQVLTLLLLSSVNSGKGEAQVKLADFGDLFKLASSSAQSSRVSSEERSDRSLANTYPFHLGERNDAHHHTHGVANSLSDHSQYEVVVDKTPSVVAARGSSLTPSLSQSLFHASASHAQASAPASSVHLNFNLQSQNSPNTGGFTLLSGFGSRLNPTSQYQIGSGLSLPQNQFGSTQVGSVASPYQAPVQAFQTAPVQGYQASPSISLASDPFAAGVSSQCPAAPSRTIQECRGAVNSCWSVGVGDVDCPGNSLCCFDGCANVCLGQTRAVVRPGPVTPVVGPVRPVVNPSQGRRKAAGETFEAVAAAGQRCIDKVEQVEEIEYDEIEECNHSYDKKCHTSYSTEYDAQQEEECDDNYKKACDITYSPHAQNVTVKVCMTPLVKDCNLSGPEVCRTEYISECWTKNDPHIVVDDVADCRTEYIEKCVETQSGYVTEQDCKKWPKERCTIKKEQRAKFNPVTKCEKVPQELCGPSGCGFVPGPEECHDEVKTVVTDIPEEVCDLTPQRTCSHVTKLVPKLTPVEECVDVPKEICQKTKGNPRTVLKNVTKKWCYTPSEESGLL